MTKPLKQSQLYDTIVRVMADQPAPPSAVPPAEFDPGMAARHPLRILLAEDNQINLKLSLHLLAKFGYRADVAGNGVEALAAVERQHYDVVLMDVQMPVMDGCEATRRLRRRWPEVPRVVALTANAMDGDREECLAAGMNDYLGKPISPEALAAALWRTPVGAERPTTPEDGPHTAVDRLLAMLGEDAPALFPELVHDFLEDGTRLVQTVRTSVEKNQSEELRRAAHTLKSTALNFGAEVLARHCREVERLARRGDVGAARAPAHDLAAEYLAVQEELKQLLDRFVDGPTAFSE